MSEKNKESLYTLMKKQISEKSSKKNVVKKSPAVLAKEKSAKEKKDGEKENENPEEEEMTEEEELEEAKDASKNKASKRDQTEMFKKLILQNLAKYVLLATILVVASIGVIKFGPALFKMLNGLLYKILMGSLGK